MIGNISPWKELLIGTLYINTHLNSRETVPLMNIMHMLIAHDDELFVQEFQGFIAAGAARTLKRFNTEVTRILPEIFSLFVEEDFFSKIRPKRY